MTVPRSTPVAAPSRGSVAPVVGTVTAYPVAIERRADVGLSASIANRFGIAARSPA